MVIVLRKLKKKLIKLTLVILLIFLAFHLEDTVKIFFPLKYQETITKYAKANQVDPYLVAAIIKTESNFDDQATSKKGAIGIMQIMPETGEWIAEQMGLQNYSTEKLYDAETNIRMGSWYISNLKKEFNEDMVLVIAAYNGGRGNVKKWLEENQWNGEKESLDQIPFPETRDYVDKVLRNQKIYHYLYDGPASFKIPGQK